MDPNLLGSVDPDPEVFNEGVFSTETAKKRPEEKTEGHIIANILLM